MTQEQYLKNLIAPKGKVDVMLDTDAYNEIDDQFAIAYMLKRTDKFNVKALTAAPFFNDHSTFAGDGMEKSYQEIKNLVKLMGIEYNAVYRGANKFMDDENEIVESEAVDVIIDLAKQYSPEKPLYVCAIGAITNVASALNKAPEIAENIVIVWLGGHAIHWQDTKEFNMVHDIAAARVVFLSKAPLVQYPCMGVVSAVTTTKPELKAWLDIEDPLCSYLCRHTIEEAETYSKSKTWSRVIWDVTVPLWFEENGYAQKIINAPIPEYDGTYSFPTDSKKIAYVEYVWRDDVFEKLFTTLTEGKI